MLRWDALEEVRVCLDAAGQDPGDAAAGAAAACTVPLVVHDFHRAAILGTATLLVAERRPVLLTAAHVFDGGVRLGNLLVPLAAGHGMVPLAGARLSRSQRADVALLDIGGVDGVADILRGRTPAQMPRVAPRRRRGWQRQARALVSGYPAALTRFERGWLAARRLTLLTRGHRGERGQPGAAEHLFDYGRLARRSDGVSVHTPELQGMSGAGIWALESTGASCRLRLAAVQSSFLHSRYLRGHDVGAAFDLLRL